MHDIGDGGHRDPAVAARGRPRDHHLFIQEVYV